MRTSTKQSNKSERAGDVVTFISYHVMIVGRGMITRSQYSDRVLAFSHSYLSESTMHRI